MINSGIQVCNDLGPTVYRYEFLSALLCEAQESLPRQRGTNGAMTVMACLPKRDQTPCDQGPQQGLTATLVP